MQRQGRRHSGGATRPRAERSSAARRGRARRRAARRERAAGGLRGREVGRRRQRGDVERRRGLPRAGPVVNILPPQLGYVAEYIADIDGFFEKEGLAVKVEHRARLRARHPGGAQRHGAAVAGGALESLIAIANRGAPITPWRSRRPARRSRSCPTRRSRSTTPQDLVGKRIGIPSEGGTSETTLDLHDRLQRPRPREDVHVRSRASRRARSSSSRRGASPASSSARPSRSSSARRSPTPTFLVTADYVKDGLNYITSEKGLSSRTRTRSRRT